MRLPPRILPNWHKAWLEVTSTLPTSSLFREWAGLFCIGACLTRRIWLQTQVTMSKLYPNLFIILCGPPGTGKDVVMNPIRRLWYGSNDIAKGAGENEGYWINIGAKSLSAKGLIDTLADDQARLVLETQTPKGIKKEYFHSVVLCVPELGTLLPEYNAGLMSNLCDLYNCDEKFDDKIRNGKSEPTIIENPHCAMLLGTQPAFLGSTFPEEAYGMGFFSRTILAHEAVPQRKAMYPEETAAGIEETNRLWLSLISDTHRLTRLVGEFSVPPDVKERINQFHMYDCDDTALRHSRFADYNTRRSLHTQKMAMCFSVAHSDKLVMDHEDWDKALDLLFRTEVRMPDIFSNLNSGRGFHNSVEEVVLSGTKQHALTEQEITRQLRRRHKPHEILPIINSMIKGGDIRVIGDQDGFRLFKVVNNTPHLKLIKGQQ